MSTMTKTIDMLKTTRKMVEMVTRPYDAAELVRMPPGFNNHLLWHVGHLVVTQQLLCYKMAGVPMAIDEALVDPFRKGSSPRQWSADYTPPGYDELIVLLHEMADRLRADYDAGLFTGYNAYMTSAGVQLESVEDAILFNNYHEGIHLGYMLGLRKALASSS